VTEKRKPRRGEPRTTRQPFSIDRLPEGWQQRIISRRAAFRTWEQIEEESCSWPWEKLPSELRAKFPGSRLPHSNMARWYDVRVEQVTREAMAEAEASRRIAAAFAGKDFAGLEESVKNALADQVFTLMRSADAKDRAKFAGALTRLGLVLSELKRADAASAKVKLGQETLDLERKKFEQAKARLENVTSDAAAKLGTGKELTLADINRIRQRALGLPPVERTATAGPAA
jgi:hypothetical protein